MHFARGNAGFRLVLAFGFTALIASLGAACTPPATITVSRAADDHDPGSLRAAIDQANTGVQQEVISLPAGTYDLSSCDASGPEDANATGDLDVLTFKGIWIVGQGAGATINQTCVDRVIDAHGTGKLWLVNVTIRGGQATDGGGGVRAVDSVVLDHAKVTDNHTYGRDGLDMEYPVHEATNGGDARGGGLSVGGDLTAISSEISHNTATGGHGGRPCVGAVGSYSTNGGSASGGGADVIGKASLSQTLVTDNAAAGNTGYSVCRLSYSPGTGAAIGGGISAASVTVDVSQVLLNQAQGAALMDYPAYVGLVAGGGVAATGTAAITGSTFGQNTAFSGYSNQGDQGAASGSAAWSKGAMTTEQSTFVANEITSQAGQVPYGGALASGTSVSAKNVTFSANVSNFLSSTVVTISAPTVDLLHVTAVGDSGAPLFAANALAMRASVLHPAAGIAGCAAGGTRTSGGDNWAHESSCGLTAPTDIVAAPATDPLLGPRQDNGGSTATHLPQAGSPLIDAIALARCTLTTDQRLAPRPSGAGCDIGAVEVQAAAPAAAAAPEAPKPQPSPPPPASAPAPSPTTVPATFAPATTTPPTAPKPTWAPAVPVTSKTS